MPKGLKGKGKKERDRHKGDRLATQPSTRDETTMEQATNKSDSDDCVNPDRESPLKSKD
jgi:hypothetical protein